MIKYIEVIAKMTEHKPPIPIKIIWETGKEYEIDKTIEYKKLASTKGGGAGIRYTIKINEKIRYLFLNGYKWFIELD